MIITILTFLFIPVSSHSLFYAFNITFLSVTVGEEVSSTHPARGRGSRGRGAATEGATAPRTKNKEEPRYPPDQPETLPLTDLDHQDDEKICISHQDRPENITGY